MNYETHSRLDRFISSLRRLNTLTNHALGFKKAFEMFWKSIGIGNATEDPDEALIIYIRYLFIDVKVHFSILEHESGWTKKRKCLLTLHLQFSVAVSCPL